jgi:iron complex outermembrane recepter protein
VKIIALAVLIISGTAGLAQTAVTKTGVVKGLVRTTDGQPAAFVNVVIPELHKGTITAEDGSFFMRGLQSGNHILVISHTGLLTEKQTVTIEAGKTAVIDVLLKQSASDLQKVIIDGRKTNNAPVSIGKAGIAPMDLPQSTSVVGQAVIRDQQANRLSEVIKNVNGIYLGTTRGSAQENFYARGYSLGANNIFKNGARINSGAMPEMSSLERVEVLKGSAAILFGNVAPGGIVNMVTKQPKFRNGAEISMRAGSYGFFKPAFDIYGPLNSSIAYRVNGTMETADSYRDNVHSKRYYINPSILFKLGKKTELIVQGDYLKHRFTPDFGIGSIGDKYIAPLSRSTFLGTPWQYALTQQATANASLKHSLSEKWQFTGSFAYQSYNRDYYSTERIQINENGDWKRPLNRTRVEEDYMIAQFDINGRFNTGNIEHTFLAGTDGERYMTNNYSYDQPTVYDTINIFEAAKYPERTDMPDAHQVRVVSTPVYRFGAYVQDLISITPNLKMLAGIRWSYQQGKAADSLNLLTSAHAFGKQKVDKAFSPRVGLVYKPFTSTSLFASYANSFSVNNGADINGNALTPSIINQFEAGIKNELLKGFLTANVTFYRIVNNNLAQTAPFKADGTQNNDPLIKALTGETTSDGIEVDLSSQPVKGLNVLAGYSYNYMRYTNVQYLKGNFVQGERLVNTPSHSANATAFYTFENNRLKGLKIGASVFYVGDRFGGWNNTVTDVEQKQITDRLIPVNGFTTVDVSAGYAFKNVSLLAKVSNLTNTFNYYVHENYSINPIAPRQFIATISYKL